MKPSTDRAGESGQDRPATGTAALFREGVGQALPLLGVVAPFAMIFGAAAVAAGYSLRDTILASAALYAGASQFVFIEVNGLGVPAWSVALAVFAVNFRHILYSASVGRKLHRFPLPAKAAGFFLLTDLQWAAGELRGTEKERGGISPAWYFGYGLTQYSTWVVATAVGGLFGALIDEPERYGFDFLLPIYFLTILMGFRQRSNFLPVVIVSALASMIAYQVLGPPWHISLGAIAGIAAAAIIAKPPRNRLVVGEGGDDDRR